MLYWIRTLYPGYHAPGLKLSLADCLRVTHNVLLSHGKAVQVLRARNKGDACLVGAAPVGGVMIPASDTAEDIEAARCDMFSVKSDSLWNISWYMDPLVLGDYPEQGRRGYGKDAPAVNPGDMDTICQPLDFYGVNVYKGDCVAHNPSGTSGRLNPREGVSLTHMDWEVTPEALYWGPRFLYERYSLPVVVTENGMANCDWVHLDGKVHDPQRIDYLHRYIAQLGKAVHDGVPVIGYFVWSIMDNFEWACGYSRRFGLIYVDYQSKERILKDSAHWYKEVIDTDGGIIQDV
ncbi:MAG: family 1 glycosylhydrolase [Chitinivibrionales bacterium]|nr:family 1 glycosylhydrolase [Chitinivibrionales bacterium]MBD3358981.1 family 1 glycosylhydrolase [Chitinivibrionales bacterium]